jgi:hypothetical protein
MKSYIVQGMKLQKFKKNLISNMVVGRETILARGCERPLDAFNNNNNKNNNTNNNNYCYYLLLS